MNDPARTSLTGFAVVNEDGFPIPADPFGNHVALHCLGCGAPLLMAPALDRGSCAENPAACPACAARHWVHVDEAKKRLVLHRA